MTLDNKDMTQDEKRLKIAEACGWSYSCRGGWGMVDSLEGPEGQTRLPDYFNDLNAMHEAEKVLKSKDKNPDKWSTWFNYTNTLGKLMAQQYRDDKLVNAIHATASQRAEAYGKTLKLW